MMTCKITLYNHDGILDILEFDRDAQLDDVRKMAKEYWRGHVKAAYPEQVNEIVANIEITETRTWS